MKRSNSKNIGLNKIDTQEEVIVEALLDSRATELAMSLEFAKNQGFKLKRIEEPRQFLQQGGVY